MRSGTRTKRKQKRKFLFLCLCFSSSSLLCVFICLYLYISVRRLYIVHIYSLAAVYPISCGGMTINVPRKNLRENISLMYLQEAEAVKAGMYCTVVVGLVLWQGNPSVQIKSQRYFVCGRRFECIR